MNSRTLSVVAFAATIAISACSSDGHDGPNGPEQMSPANGSNDIEGMGSVGMQLTLPSGQSIQVIEWVVTGPNGATTVVRSGTATSQSSGAMFLVGNIPVGTNYQIALSGTASDGSVTCSGAARFDIVSRSTTPVMVQLTCAVATSGSHVTLVNGSSFNCAAWNDVSANPTETSVGSSVALFATATGPEPGSLTYAWSAPSGSFTAPNSATTSFQCTTAGSVPVTLVVGDGPVPAGDSCSTSLTTRTISITCDTAVPPPAAPAMPPWGVFATALAMLGIGSGAIRRRHQAQK